MTYSDYATSSQFVQDYAINRDGLPPYLPGSDVIDTAEKVVLIDTLLRNHSTTFSIGELIDKTSLQRSTIESALDEFQRANLVTLENSLFIVNKQNEVVTEIRKHQNKIN